MSDLVLLVEDEAALARGLLDYFRHVGYDVRHVRRGDAAFEAVREVQPHVVILDIIVEVCGLDSEATLRTVDNHIVALRRALGDDPKRPRFLHTVRGQGYRLSLREA